MSDRLAAHQRGHGSETKAALWLRLKGYRILARRLKTHAGEIDLVAAAPFGPVCFVEVKARQDGSFGDPEEAVTLRKQQQLVWMATDYLARHVAGEVACRFDVVGINTRTDPPSVTLIEDAFRPGW